MKKIFLLIAILWASIGYGQKILGEGGRRIGVIFGQGIILDSLTSNSNLRINKDSAISKSVMAVINQNNDTVFTIRIPKLSYGGRSFGIGYRALRSMSSGNYPAGGYPYGNGNVAIGDFSAWQLLEGNENTAVGAAALYNLTGIEGADPNVVAALNTAIGSNAGYHLLDGGRNVFIGQKAGYSSTNAVGNVYIGKSAASNANNDTANTIINGADGDFNGKYNTIIGKDGGRDNIANYTTGIGASTLYRNTQDYITAIGYQAGVQQTSGLRNLYIGAFAGASISTAGDGIYIGYRAGDISTGANNIVIGSQSGRDITTGTNNLVIGTTVNSLGATVSNGMVIKNAIFGTGLNGFSSTIPASGKVGIFIASPSARLHLAAGTATATTAPLKFTSGVNLTTPEAGAMEFDGTHFYGTIGSTRTQLDNDPAGVTSIIGTTNQVIASASTGAITLSTPQNIHTGASPQFSSLGINSSAASGIGLFVGGSISNALSGVSFNPTLNLSSSVSSTGISVIGGTMVEPSSGSITDLSSLVVRAPTITPGAATVGSIYTLIVDGAPTATVTDVNGIGGLWVKNGSTRLDGSIIMPITTATENSTLDKSNYTVLGDASGGSLTISLPSAASCTGIIYVIKKIDGSINSITIDPNGSETIDGSSTISITAQWNKYTIQSTGSNWVLL